MASFIGDGISGVLFSSGVYRSCRWITEGDLLSLHDALFDIGHNDWCGLFGQWGPSLDGDYVVEAGSDDFCGGSWLSEEAC